MVKLQFVLLKDWIATIHDYSFMIVEVYDCWVLLCFAKPVMRSGARLFYCLSLFLLLVLVLVLLLAVGGGGGGVWTRQYTLYPFRCARGTSTRLFAAGNPP